MVMAPFVAVEPPVTFPDVPVLVTVTVPAAAVVAPTPIAPPAPPEAVD